MSEQKSVKYQVPLICLVLAMITLVAFEQVRRNDFVSFDDLQYVTDNPNVNQGLSGESIAWAFTSGYASNWHPLTWLSHMADCELYGLRPAGHHITNLLLHILNTLLLFWVFRKMTGSVWPSAFVAAVFAIHPLHVESVAWVAERKDVLSTLFWLGTMIAYVRYTERSSMGNSVLVALLFGLGLMAKPMLVTLPFVLLLLDYWPLRRFDTFSIRRLVGEKIPLFVLAAGSSVITFLVQQKGGAVIELENISVASRLGNALVSYVGYIGKMIYPSGLAVLYPYPAEGVGSWRPLVAVALLAGLTLFFIRLAAKQRYVLVGWLWYLITLVPVIGIVQVGGQAMADRYTYIPSIGIFVVVAWGLGDLLSRWKYKRAVLSIFALIAILLATLATRNQVAHWRNTLALYKHTLDVTENNHVIHSNYAIALNEEGRTDEAIEHYQQALKIEPDHADAHYNLGVVFEKMGNFEQAIKHYQQLLKLEPDSTEVHYNLGVVLGIMGKREQAIAHYQRALKIKPDYAEAHYNLGVVLWKTGKREQAIEHYQKALKLKPDFTEARYNLGVVLGKTGNHEEAIEHLQQTLKLKPDYADAHYFLGVVLGKTGKRKQAIEHFQQAVKLKPDDLDAHYKLGNEFVNMGKFDQAIEHFQQALRLRPDFADAHYNLGVLLGKMGNLEQAVEHFQKTLQLDPQNFEAHNKLAQLYHQQKQPDRTVAHLAQSLAFEPQQPRILNMLAWLKAAYPRADFHDPDEAVRLARRCCQLTGFKNPEHLDTLAVAYAAAGQFTKAIETTEKAISHVASKNQSEMLDMLRDRLKLYGKNQPVSLQQQ